MEAYLGLVCMFAGNFAPRGWAFCDGSLLEISQHTAVFALLGTTYGGDGKTNFALPNLNVEGSGKPNYIICLEGIFPTRD